MGYGTREKRCERDEGDERDDERDERWERWRRMRNRASDRRWMTESDWERSDKEGMLRT